MHGQATSKKRKPYDGKVAKARRRLGEPERAALRLISEQVAIPLDQLARFLDGGVQEAVRIAGRLEEIGCVGHRRFLVADFPWLWLNSLGAQLVDTSFPSREPDVASLAHRRALNEIRLYLADRAPAGKWVCERVVYRRRDPADHIPDAILEIDGERHAIEAELTPKRHPQLRRIIAQHSNRYDAVIYFCNAATYPLLKRMQEEGRFPKLAVQHLPEAPPW